MGFTDNRRIVLSALIENAHLKTNEFYGVFGISEDHPHAEGKKRNVRSILLRAKLEGLVNRKRFVPRSVDDGLNREPHIYFLSEKGLAKAREEGLDPDHKGKANDEKSIFTLEHESTITGIHQAIQKALGKDLWWRQSNLRHRFVHERTKYMVNPDALFYLDGYYYFLEFERSKPNDYDGEGRPSIVRKAEKYLAYANRTAKHFKEKWPEMEGFRLLIVVLESGRGYDERRRNLLDRLKKDYPTKLIWVANLDDVMGNPLGEIWQTPKDYADGLIYTFPRNTEGVE